MPPFLQDGHSFKDLDEFNGHREVSFLYDPKTGLRAIVAIHNDTMGPALGATRMWPYANEMEALRAALRLSRLMTYKAAMAGLSYGGGKAVILGDSKTMKTHALLEEYARRVHEFGGRFMTGTDVGLTDRDVALMRGITPYVIGSRNHGKASPSVMAALGVFSAIEGCFEELRVRGGVKRKKFAIKGLGKTGFELLRLLHGAGAKIVAADLDENAAARVKKQFPDVKIVDPAVIHRQKVDVFCPCALADDLNQRTIRELQCLFVAGTENNQLESPEIGDLLHRLGIVYAPDYVVNAGGLIAVVEELGKKGYNEKRVLARVNGIRKTIRKVIARAKREGKPTHRVADKMAEEIVAKRAKR